mmetsp:Transcript_103009/g.317842  ORF Transcript_103009/g.317842 Transcript_103009/m.317842 type:complete len:214 (-) Transcript_103009:33-674(-)
MAAARPAHGGGAGSRWRGSRRDGGEQTGIRPGAARLEVARLAPGACGGHAAGRPCGCAVGRAGGSQADAGAGRGARSPRRLPRYRRGGLGEEHAHSRGPDPKQSGGEVVLEGCAPVGRPGPAGPPAGLTAVRDGQPPRTRGRLRPARWLQRRKAPLHTRQRRPPLFQVPPHFARVHLHPGPAALGVLRGSTAQASGRGRGRARPLRRGHCQGW